MLSSGKDCTWLPRVICKVVLPTGWRTPPAAAKASSKRSPLGVKGMRKLAATSPTTVTLELALRITLTSTCGKLALALSALVMVTSISWGDWPAALTAPTNGTLMVPVLLTICSGRVVMRAPEAPDRGSTVAEPNRLAGGASQIAISSTSPAPTLPVTTESPKVSENKERCWLAITLRATASLISTT